MQSGCSLLRQARPRADLLPSLPLAAPPTPRPRDANPRVPGFLGEEPLAILVSWCCVTFSGWWQTVSVQVYISLYLYRHTYVYIYFGGWEVALRSLPFCAQYRRAWRPPLLGLDAAHLGPVTRV